MAIQIGRYGELSCNTILRTWGVGRNLCSWNGGLVPYPNDVGKCWADGNNHLYNSLEMSSNDFKITGSYYYYELRDTTYVRQRLPAMTSGHKYFFGCYAKVSGGTGYMRILNNNSIKHTKSTTSSSWTWISNVVSPSTDYSAGNYQGSSGAALTFNCSAGSFSFTKIIIFDITEMFGSDIASSLTNTQWRNWIDGSCREIRCLLNAEHGSNMTNRSLWIAWGTASNWNATSWKSYYPAQNMEMVDNTEVPWGIWLHAITNSAVEHYVYSDTNYGPVTNRIYYMSEYARLESCIDWSNDFFISETGSNFLGSVPVIATQSKYGGCKNWRKISKVGQPGATTSAKCRIDLNGSTSGRNTYWTLGTYESMGSRGTDDSNWFQLYNAKFSCGLVNTSSGVNSYFYDCWSETVTQPFIHCPSPADKRIRFNTNYDIECNDIIIEPQKADFYFDEYGRIHCSSLSVNQNTFV